MKTLAISKVITLPNRQRRIFDEGKMREFAEGIEKRGLFHPIVARWNEPAPGEPRQLVLVAGERRLRAITDLATMGVQIRCDGEEVPLGHIPYTLLEELDPLAYEEAELEENIHRVDLSWQEKAAAHSRLMKLRTAQAGEGQPPTVADIAMEVRGTAEGKDHDLIKKELIVARYLHLPEVQAAANVFDAFKVLKKKENAERYYALGAQVGVNFTAKEHQVAHGDSLAWMRAASAETFDCILTDPPYGMNADEFGDSGGRAEGAHGYADSWEYAEQCYTVLATEGFRVAKAQAHLYAFCDLDNFGPLKAMFAAAGWTVFRTPLLWYKRHGSRAPWPEMGPQRRYETLLYCVKGKRPTLKMTGDVLDFAADTNLGHSAQKPVALYAELLSRTCLPGDRVLDPFCGTGPIFPAAHGLKVRATGVEMDGASYGIAVNRLGDLRLDPPELP